MDQNLHGTFPKNYVKSSKNCDTPNSDKKVKPKLSVAEKPANLSFYMAFKDTQMRTNELSPKKRDYDHQ